MKQLTGVDASFLYMETPTTFGHVTGLLIFERPSPDWDPFAHVYEMYESLIGKIEPLRRRLVEVPFNLDHPYWIDDPNFDLSFHVRALNLAAPGMADQLAEQVSRIHGRPMDRTRPLWEVYVVDGLGSGRWALLTKTHHATIDGAAGQIMLNMLMTEDPEPQPIEPSPPWEPEKVPADPEMFMRAIGNLWRNPIKAMQVQARMAQEMANAAGIKPFMPLSAQGSDAARQSIRNVGRGRTAGQLSPAPPTPWNKAITPHRRYAIRSASLSNIKRIKEAFGGTVNDVVMAICAGGLRTYLERHNALPDRPLRAMVPVSIRSGDEEDAWTNRVSAIFCDLPTNEADPVERLNKCREIMADAKKQWELVPAHSMIEASQFASPIISTAAIRLASQLRMADWTTPMLNVTISNVPGPREPRYFQGAKLAHQFPVSIVTDGQGLNITVQSYLDNLDFGLISDRELIPDLWTLIDDLIDEIEVLIEATGAERAEPPRQAYPRYGSRMRTSPDMIGTVASGKTDAPGTPADAGAEPAKKAAAKKSPAKKTAAKKTAAKKAPAKKTAAKKAPAKKAAAKTTAAKKTTAKKAATKKTAAKKAPAKKAAEPEVLPDAPATLIDEQAAAAQASESTSTAAAPAEPASAESSSESTTTPASDSSESSS